MDNVTVYEFLQEKSVTPTGPGSYSDSTEMSNALKVFKKNSSPKTKGKKDVNFYDYDGSLIDSYSTEEFLQLSTMPENPSHDGLTAQGWNYTLSDAKEYISNYRKLDIGQMYVTDNGKTRIHINLKGGRLKPCLGLGINGSAIVDWGDNSQTDTMSGSDLTIVVYQEHEYSTPGKYTISIAVTGEIVLLGDPTNGSQVLTKTDGNVNTNKVYLSTITLIELGSNITSIGSSAFSYCYSLTNITIPDSVISIGDNAFQGCYSLTNVTIPDSVTSIGSNAFSYCYSLTNVTIPDSVTSIDSYMFNSCNSLTSVIIPDSVTSIGNQVFNSCNSLINVIISDSVTSIGHQVFNNCNSLINVIISDSVTSIGSNAFSYCYSLTNVTIPDSVTSIGNNAFQGCYSLTNVTIPDSVTSIGSNAFQSCSGLGFIKFKRAVPATVSSSFTWGNIPTDCIIYVPQGSLSAYTSASNYPTSSKYTYIEY